ncbi:MAG: DUF445 domain-containing protein [Cellulosilyticaceae bacterium]
MTLSFLMGPIVGGIIGYITNSIAIKMLFRPLKPIYVCGKRLPFTPGMIPREQERIAKTIGEVVGRELIDEATLREHLLSQEMVVKLEAAVDEWVNTYKTSEATVEEALDSVLGESTIKMLGNTIEEGLTYAAYQKIVSMRLGEPLAKQAVQAISGNLGPMAMFVSGSLLETAETKLQEIIQSMIEEQGEEVIETVISREKEQLLQTPVSTVVGRIEEELPRVKYVLMNQYVNLVQNQLTKMIQTVDIKDIVEQKIKNYDVLEMEKIILSIVKKELNAIVWLGALLGAVMGVIMNFF